MPCMYCGVSRKKTARDNKQHDHPHSAQRAADLGGVEGQGKEDQDQRRQEGLFQPYDTLVSERGALHRPAKMRSDQTLGHESRRA